MVWRKKDRFGIRSEQRDSLKGMLGINGKDKILHAQVREWKILLLLEGYIYEWLT